MRAEKNFPALCYKVEAKRWERKSSRLTTNASLKFVVNCFCYIELIVAFPFVMNGFDCIIFQIPKIWSPYSCTSEADTTAGVSQSLYADGVKFSLFPQIHWIVFQFDVLN